MPVALESEGNQGSFPRSLPRVGIQLVQVHDKEASGDRCRPCRIDFNRLSLLPRNPATDSLHSDLFSDLFDEIIRTEVDLPPDQTPWIVASAIFVGHELAIALR